MNQTCTDHFFAPMSKLKGYAWFDWGDVRNPAVETNPQEARANGSIKWQLLEPGVHVRSGFGTWILFDRNRNLIFNNVSQFSHGGCLLMQESYGTFCPSYVFLPNILLAGDMLDWAVLSHSKRGPFLVCEIIVSTSTSRPCHHVEWWMQ